MAKLNVVIPAVEVTVGDVTYRKVDRKAQAGDIVKILRNGLHINYGDYFAIDADLKFRDNGGGTRSITHRINAEHEVYAPISEPAVQPSTDTITFEGATWRKVDRDVREGDAIKFTRFDDEEYSENATLGEMYLVHVIDMSGDAQIVDDKGAEYDTCGDDFEVYEKVADSAAVEYREVKRKAEVGEKIRVTNVHRSDEEFSEGDVLTVSRVDGAGDIWYAEEVDIDGLIFYQHPEHGNEYVVLEPVTKSAGTTQPERLAVGDYVRVAVEYCEHNVGDVLKINSTASLHDFYVTNVATSRLGCIDADKLVKLTAAEIAELERKQAEEAVKRAEEEAIRREETKWNAIGRKVNEYKRGDIVLCVGKAKAGLGEVQDDASGDRVRVEYYSIFGTCSETFGIITLVSPAEQRFDREEVDAA